MSDMTTLSASDLAFAAAEPSDVDTRNPDVARTEINSFDAAMFHCRARVNFGGVFRRGYQFTASDVCAEEIAAKLGLDVYRVTGNVFIALLPIRVIWTPVTL